jgi:hypothetical protein
VTIATAYEALRAWLFRRELDRRIAHGADPSASPELRRRARQLVSRGFRARLAAGLRRTIAAAEQPWQQRRTAQVPVQRGAILNERALLIGLARLLTEEETVSARGVARVEQLLTDGRSPLYYPAPRGALPAALRHARATLLLG